MIPHQHDLQLTETHTHLHTPTHTLLHTPTHTYTLLHKHTHTHTAQFVLVPLTSPDLRYLPSVAPAESSDTDGLQSLFYHHFHITQNPPSTAISPGSHYGQLVSLSDASEPN